MGAVLRRAAIAAVVGAALSGCTSSVTTELTVTGPQAATITVTAAFTGEAADTITGNPATLTSLVGVFQDRTGTVPRVVRGSHALTVAADVSYARLTTSAAITGVRSAALSGSADRATIVLELVAVPDLAAAVTGATRSQPDAAALTQTMLQQTDVQVRVVFPGGVTAASSSPDVHRDATAVTVTRSAADAAAQTVTVTGDPTASWLSTHRPLEGGAAVLAVLGLVTLRRRRRS